MRHHQTTTRYERARRPRANTGHTLVEIVIVVAVMAAIAGLALPRLDYVTMRLDANARATRGVLQQAWRLAIQKQHDILVGLDTAGHRLRVHEDLDTDGQIDSGERVTWRPLEEGVRFVTPPSGVAGAVSGAVAGPGVRTMNGLPTIVFRRNGSTSGDAELYLGAVERGGTRHRAVTVAQSTGRTEWFRWTNGAWHSGGI